MGVMFPLKVAPYPPLHPHHLTISFLALCTAKHIQKNNLEFFTHSHQLFKYDKKLYSDSKRDFVYLGSIIREYIYLFT